ncbi:MAG: hypothetical protein KDC87_13210 [Planctomycetes bacterium]|nr:hypothetical protein [Planctomycetota bacterium]MCB9872064.1 hypothetical protein [Planctomycetota bacterium]
MLRTLTCTVLTASLVLAAAADAAAQRKRSSWRDRVGLKHLDFKSDLVYPTTGKGVKRATYCVFLPRDYAAEQAKQRRYPVIYFLHGMFEDSKRFFTQGGAPVLDKLVGDGVLPEHVFVCVDDTTRRSFYVNGKQMQIEDMILKDLVPHIEKTYRVEKGRAHRALLGISMGGFGALKIAFKHPEFFGVVATHSAAILPEKFGDVEKAFPWIRQYGNAARTITSLFGDPVDEKLWAAENPLTLARQLTPEKLAGLKVYFDCGDRDRYNFEEPNTTLHKVLDRQKIPHHWKLVRGGNHGWRAGYNQRALPDSLRFIATVWRQKAATAGLSGLLGGKPAHENKGEKAGEAGKKDRP